MNQKSNITLKTKTYDYVDEKTLNDLIGEESDSEERKALEKRRTKP